MTEMIWHAGEYVLSASAACAGGPAALEALNRAEDVDDSR